MLKAESNAALASFKAKDPTLRLLLDKAAGYAIFPDVGKAGLVVGGSQSHNEVYQGVELIGYADISQGSIGVQIGGQTFA